MMANKSEWKNQQSKHQRRNHHLREIILAILVVLSVAATVCPYSAQAATPKVLVSGYKVSAATIYSGDNFNLTLEIQNTSKNKVRNMKVTAASEGGEIIPVSEQEVLMWQRLLEMKPVSRHFPCRRQRDLQRRRTSFL